MKWLDKMERKFGRYAIRNLPAYIIAMYIAGYLFLLLTPSIFDYLTLNPVMILRGQVWRLITWVLVPPSNPDIFTIIMLYFYYSIGKTLERTWGDFRFNVYIFSGMLFTVIGAFVLYFIYGYLLQFYVGNFSTYYINMSIFLAFAASYPDMEVYLYFLFPIKMKWMGMVYGAMLIYEAITTNWINRVVMICSLLNFLIFFFLNRNHRSFSPKDFKRKTEFKKAAATATKIKESSRVHKCAICGRTSEDDPTLEFRYCSKCEGNYEYCQDHLFTHEHVHKH